MLLLRQGGGGGDMLDDLAAWVEMVWEPIMTKVVCVGRPEVVRLLRRLPSFQPHRIGPYFATFGIPVVERDPEDDWAIGLWVEMSDGTTRAIMEG
jgi:hypothetical protein